MPDSQRFASDIAAIQRYDHDGSDGFLRHRAERRAAFQRATGIHIEQCLVVSVKYINASDPYRVPEYVITRGHKGPHSKYVVENYVCGSGRIFTDYTATLTV